MKCERLAICRGLPYFVHMKQDLDPEYIFGLTEQQLTTANYTQEFYRAANWTPHRTAYLKDRKYADDWTILTTDCHTIQLELNLISSRLRMFGLHLNAAKSKVQALNQATGPLPLITIGDTPLEWVRKFTLLGVPMTAGHAYPVSDLETRINVAKGKFYSKLHYLTNPAIHMKARFQHLLQEILPVFYSQAQIWSWPAKALHKIDSAVREMILRMTHRSNYDCISFVRCVKWLHLHGIKLHPAHISTATLKLRYFSRLHHPNCNETQTFDILCATVPGPPPPAHARLRPPSSEAVVEAAKILRVPVPQLLLRNAKERDFTNSLDDFRSAATLRWLNEKLGTASVRVHKKANRQQRYRENKALLEMHDEDRAAHEIHDRRFTQKRPRKTRPFLPPMKLFPVGPPPPILFQEDDF